jgi:hypothetical protein
MAGYIGKSQGVTQVDGYNRSEADAEFVQVAGDTMTGALAVNGNLNVDTNTLFVDAENNRVGVGTTSPDTALNIGFAGADQVNTLRIEGSNGSSERYALDIEADGANTRTNFKTAGGGGAPTTRMTIDSSGNLLVGTTDDTPAEPGSSGNYGVSIRAGSSSQFSVNDTEAMWLNRDSDGDIMRFRRSLTGVGSISVTASATAYNTSSDYRLKEDVQPMVGASDRLMALKPVNFAWKADGSRVDGFLAHEAQEVVPEAIHGTKDQVQIVEIKDEDGNVTGTEEQPVYQGIDQSKIVPLLTAALQEALTKIEQLEARMAILEGGAA